jgi:hypothetical protein
MIALFNPVHRRGEGIKWGLVSYTVVMFSFATVLTAMQFNIQSLSFIDYRGSADLGGGVTPAPLGYWFPNVLATIPNVMFASSNWLADGLLVSSLFEAEFIRPGA